MSNVACPTMFIFLLFAYPFLPTAHSASCQVSIEYKKGDLKEPQPLILTKDGDQFLYPKNRNGSMLELAANNVIHLACPGFDDSNFFNNIPSKPSKVTATCINDKTFAVERKPQAFSKLTCKRNADVSTRILATEPCLGVYTTIEIGFKINATFLPIMKLCRNDTTYETLYTKFSMSKTHGNIQCGYPRPKKWNDQSYFGRLDMGKLYNWNVQVNITGEILKSTVLAKKLITKDQFLSRGHLAAKCDFVYGSQQTATFSYLNVAPQWVSFNRGNWETLEKGVQNFATDRYLDLEVYTGVHGEMTMADINGKQQIIRLIQWSSLEYLKVPKFFWKVIYSPSNKLGTAFVGLNDPFISSIDDTVYLCKNRIESSITWLTWNTTNIYLGVVYACPVNSLRRQIPTIPALEVSGVLI